MPEFITKLDLAEQLLLRVIASGEVAPGERLRQNDLAVRFGVSATPIREALLRLEAQGLLVRDPHRGVRVAEVDVEETAELYLVRAVLEGLAVEHAVPYIGEKKLAVLTAIQERTDDLRVSGSLKALRKLNFDFHTGIYRASQLPRLTRLIDSLWPLFPWDSMWAVPGRAESSAREHRAILKAIGRNDTEGAGHAMRRHIESGATALSAFRLAQTETPGTEQRKKVSRRAQRGT
ncbi:MAG: GntR family transcriptional regulator [Candidatus Dormibacteraeota bacterium]|uniref:GntR family transcriptional regulator n=1 Tax=Candidatus Aeolococcus gillhamiae TaxID=3127015 RepID=A0A934N513_9BACT|nr:GntR family transcriptional regulator [Candidatus Dormibacteraeota bacterium]